MMTIITTKSTIIPFFQTMYRPQPQPPPNYRGGGGGGAVVLPDAADVGSIVVSSARTFARRHKIITGGYLFGILVLIFAGSGTKLTLEQAQQYNSIMNTINLEAEYNASHDYYLAQQAYHASKGWWFSCDSLCQRNKDRMNDRYAILQEIRQEGNARMSDAKAVAGLFSQVGVGEVKDSFWQYFHQGKQFAKRQSMWDAMFMGIRHMGRDESMVEYVLRVLMQVLVNFSMGLLMALVIFVFGLWSIIKSYQPNPLVALVFFLSATCAAFAFVTTYLLAIYGATAGGLYGMAKLAETNARAARLEQGRGGRPHIE